jgi:hypothetical protein
MSGEGNGPPTARKKNKKNVKKLLTNGISYDIIVSTKYERGKRK